MKRKALPSVNFHKHDRNLPVSSEFAAIFQTDSTSQRVQELQARAWQAIDSNIANIEALTTDAFLKIRVANLVRTARYWRRKIEDLHK